MPFNNVPSMLKVQESNDRTAARAARFRNDAKANPTKFAAPKKCMAWSDGTVTSNKDEAMKKFLARKQLTDQQQQEGRGVHFKFALLYSHTHFCIAPQ